MSIAIVLNTVRTLKVWADCPVQLVQAVVAR